MGGNINKLENTNSVKQRLRVLVKDYIKVFPEEYEAVRKDIKEFKLTLRSTDASTQMDSLDRELFRLPETLHAGLKSGLTDAEWAWYDSKEGARWFAKEYGEFRVTGKI